jgi:Family of unknown function (DUF6283)
VHRPERDVPLQLIPQANSDAIRACTRPRMREGVVADSVEFRTFPCAECPWRRDADLSLFTDSDFATLRAADAGVIGTINDPAEVDDLLAAPSMVCHKDQPGTPHPLRLCAGWLVVVGHHHLGTRIRIATGALPGAAVVPDENWPPLYEDLDELLRHRPDAFTRGRPDSPEPQS